MDDDKMVETAMRTAFIRQHGIELPEWINDHKKTCLHPVVIEEAQLSLGNVLKFGAGVILSTFIVGGLSAAFI